MRAMRVQARHGISTRIRVRYRDREFGVDKIVRPAFTTEAASVVSPGLPVDLIHLVENGTVKFHSEELKIVLQS